MPFVIITRNLLLVFLSLSLVTGCSISYSSGKSSDSSTSSSTSSAGSDSSKKAGTEVTNYMEDVSAMTVLCLSQKHDSAEFQRHITEIAINHSITDWEKENSTFIAMGKGLNRAGVNSEEITSLPYFKTLSQSPKYSLLLEGLNG
ncbi:putative lipoprotein [bacterium]|nr:putative lipoprotein [bacterium]